MIISFRFKNFRSFLDETFIDMKAVNYKEHSNHMVMAGNKKLIKSLAVYGANSSGKTNLFLAFASFHSFIFWQLFSMKDVTKTHFMTFLKISGYDKIIPFLDDDTNTVPIEMELSFISGQHVYEYGFSILKNKILKEHLVVDNHGVFTRYSDEISIGRQYEKSLRQKTGFRPLGNRLFCSVLSCLDIPDITEIMKHFEAFFSNRLVYHCDSLTAYQLSEHLIMDGSLSRELENKEAISFALAQLRKLGIPAVDFYIDKAIPMLVYRVKSRTTGEYQLQYLDYTKVSLGTIKYIQLSLLIYNLSKTGGVLIIDNISDELHPSVIKYFIDSFQKEKNSDVQIIFTTYDTSILNNQQFRRDEVAFVDINEFQESRVYTLADIKVRSDASFSKDYLLGKYGAIPLIKDNIL